MPEYPWQRVLADLRARIGVGREFPPGAKLPSRRELCESYGVSDIVIDRVMWHLRQDGAVETLHGVGVFVRDDHPESG